MLVFFKRVEIRVKASAIFESARR